MSMLSRQRYEMKTLSGDVSCSRLVRIRRVNVLVVVVWSPSDASMDNGALHDELEQLDDDAFYNLLVFQLPHKTASVESISSSARSAIMYEKL